MGQRFKDVKNVEDALKNLQAEKQWNDKGKLDGKDAQQAGAKTPEDYKKVYDDLMAKLGQGGQGRGRGDGQNGNGQANGNVQNGNGRTGNAPGIGNGGSVGEDPSAK